MQLNFGKSYCLMLTLFLIMPCMARNERDCEITKYVQAGACEDGNGSKKHPYSTLAQAQADSSWDTLIVLPSTTRLNGGITLLDGQKIVGEQDPTGISLSPKQPTIMNSDALSNGGNGIVVTGDATIKNIHIRDVVANGIKYDDAKNLTIKNILLTGAFAIGIAGDCKNSGETHIEHIRIVPESGKGVLEKISGGIKRELNICSSEFAQFLATVIEADALDMNTLSKVTIRNCFFRDSFPQDGGNQFIIQLMPTNGAQQIARIVDSAFAKNIFANEINADPRDSGSHLDLEVDGCTMKIASTVNNGRAAIRFRNFNGSTSELFAKNNVIEFKDTFVTSFFNTPGANGSMQKVTLCNNKVTAREFYFALNNVNNQPALEVKLKSNIFNAVPSPSLLPIAIELRAVAPWGSFVLNAEHNCFIGDTTGTAFNIFAANQPFATSASIKARHNNIEKFATDINDTKGNVIYLVRENWWGPSTGPCNVSGDCGTYQTCISGNCFGPDVVVITASTSQVFAEKPLVDPIRCPQACCP